MKQCTKCEVFKEDDQFYKRRGGRLHSWCIDCTKQLRVQRNPEIAAYQKVRRLKQGSTGVLARKDYSLQWNFGITLREYQEMLERQGYACAICAKPHGADTHAGERKKGLSVDHNHDTGEVRGLLCYDCNRAIGQLRDSPVLLRKAAEYLEHWAKVHGKAAFTAEQLLEGL